MALQISNEVYTAQYKAARRWQKEIGVYELIFICSGLLHFFAMAQLEELNGFKRAIGKSENFAYHHYSNSFCAS